MKLTILSFLLLAMAGNTHKKVINNHTQDMTNLESNPPLQVATFASGCFWCTEAIFQNVDGVEKVVSGYMGGKVKNHNYKDICTRQREHAKVIQRTYDPK